MRLLSEPFSGPFYRSRLIGSSLGVGTFLVERAAKVSNFRMYFHEGNKMGGTGVTWLLKIVRFDTDVGLKIC